MELSYYSLEFLQKSKPNILQLLSAMNRNWYHICVHVKLSKQCHMVADIQQLDCEQNLSRHIGVGMHLSIRMIFSRSLFQITAIPNSQGCLTQCSSAPPVLSHQHHALLICLCLVLLLISRLSSEEGIPLFAEVYIFLKALHTNDHLIQKQNTHFLEQKAGMSSPSQHYAVLNHMWNTIYILPNMKDCLFFPVIQLIPYFAPGDLQELGLCVYNSIVKLLFISALSVPSVVQIVA